MPARPIASSPPQRARSAPIRSPDGVGNPLADVLGADYHQRILLLNLEGTDWLDTSGIGWIVTEYRALQVGRWPAHPLRRAAAHPERPALRASRFHHRHRRRSRRRSIPGQARNPDMRNDNAPDAELEPADDALWHRRRFHRPGLRRAGAARSRRATPRQRPVLLRRGALHPRSPPATWACCSASPSCRPSWAAAASPTSRAWPAWTSPRSAGPRTAGGSSRAATRSIDLRINTLPTLYGEDCTMRLLDRADAAAVAGQARADPPRLQPPAADAQRAGGPDPGHRADRLGQDDDAVRRA